MRLKRELVDFPRIGDHHRPIAVDRLSIRALLPLPAHLGLGCGLCLRRQALVT